LGFLIFEVDAGFLLAFAAWAKGVRPHKPITSRDDNAKEMGRTKKDFIGKQFSEAHARLVAHRVLS
jgi:hypothetical protein